MNQKWRVMHSPFMEWIKTLPPVRYNLTSSGLMNYPLSELPVQLDDLELSGSSSYGYKPLQQALAKKCHVAEENIFSTIGTSLANHIAMAVLTQPRDEVLIEHPTYELLLSTAQYLNLQVKRFQRKFENGFQIDVREIERTVSSKTRLIVLTNLHNPSSVLTDEKTLKQVGEIAQSIGARVLVDEVYLDAAFELKPRSAFHYGDEFVTTNSLTKVYGLSGLRCGWVLADPDLIRTMWRLNDLFTVIPSHPSERLSVIALDNFEHIADWARNILTASQAIFNSWLQTQAHVHVIPPNFGTVIFPCLKSGSVDELSSLVQEKYSTAIVPGRFFEMPNFFRIGLGHQKEILETGLKWLSTGFEELTNR
ncbi:MAG: aminotransferase class I/II-fold pyridoxal phosphate-dependent enzyme [Ignavibacteriae bacterium]|nr:aminotransferase class I/II-fold pyridoxal phosphate-dependent enzyme [Ignavibacteriota bacterium]